MKGLFNLKFYILPLIALMLLSSCSQSTDTDQESGLMGNQGAASQNEDSKPRSKSDKVVGTDFTQARSKSENKPDNNEGLNKYLTKNFNNTAILGKNYNDLNKEEIEKMLLRAFENIDPLEYYLQNNPRYTDKANMFSKKMELNKLYELYTKKFYDRGHLQEMRDNNAVLVSLINDAYPIELIEKYDSVTHKENSSLIRFKKNDAQSFDLSNADPLSELNRAVVLLSEGDFNGADLILERLLNGPLPNNYLVNYNKGYVAFKKRDFKTCNKYANRSILAREDFYLGYLLLGESFLSQGDYNQALRAFQKSLELKNNVVSMERVAYAHALSGDFYNASRIYTSIIDGQKDHGIKNYKALKAFSKIPFDEKNEILSTARFLANTHSTWNIPPLIAAYKELFIKNYNEASKHCEKALSLEENFYSKLGLAIAAYKLKEFNKASELFSELNRQEQFAQYKYHKELLLIQIFSHTNSENFSQAYEKLIDYRAYHKKDEYYYLGMSLITYNIYDFKGAETYLDSIKNNKIFETDYTYLKGLYALRNDNFNIAKLYFDKSNNKQPNVRAMNGIGAIFNEKGEYKKAMEIFEKALLEEPNNPFVLFNKASSIFLKAKDLHTQKDTVNARQASEFAIDILRKAKSIKSDFLIDINIGNAYSNIEDYPLAIKFFSLAKDAYSENNIGVIEARLNNLDKAKELWSSIVSNSPQVQLAQYNLDESTKSNPTYKSYYAYYYDITVNVDIPVPIVFDRMFEPLVPLGHSSFKFHTLTKN
jgi:tetratricopeptide (TPR) repeat protein